MKRVLAAFALAAICALPAEAAPNSIRTSAQPIKANVANAALTFDLFSGETLMGVNVTGLAASGATITIEGSTDARADSDPNKVWFPTVAIPFTCPAPATFSTLAADEPFKIDVSGLTNLRFRVSSAGSTAGPILVGLSAIPAATLGSCGGTGGGGGGGSVNIHDSSGNALNSTGGALNVAGTFSATLGGFTPSSSGARMTPMTVQTTDTSQTLPTGAVAVVSNVGASNPMYCNVNGVAATTSDQLIPPDSWFAFTIPATITALHCIATGGTTIANGVGGAGLPTGAGGGGGGSGGGGAITSPLGVQAIAASVAVNPATSSVWPISAASLPLPSGAATSALQTAGNTTLSSILTGLGTTSAWGVAPSGNVLGANASLPDVTGVAGVAVPGKGLNVGGWQPTSGFWEPFILDATQALKVGFSGVAQPINLTTWAGTAITNVPTAVGTAGTGNTPTINAYIVGGASGLTWPGSAGTGTLGATGTGTAPYVNAYVVGANNNGLQPASGSSPVVQARASHASTTALATSLSASGAAANLLAYNCTAITGGAAGFCVAYNSATTPATGALTGSLVLDFCYFDTTARGCSLTRTAAPVAYSAGVQILVTSAASPYTYTTGADTAAISADFE